MQYIDRYNKFSFLKGGGEMGKRIRNYQWENTPLGKPDEWPQSLFTTLSIILNSKFPMFLWWGEDLIQFYNDAYRPSLGDNGKHPKALGQGGEDCWQEIWPIIKPLIAQVFAGGESIWSEDQLIPIYRNGKMEDVYWTFGYSPVIDESGKVGGVLVICNETTEKVKQLTIVRDKEQTFRNIFNQAPVAVAIYKGPAFIIELANEKVLEYWGRKLEQVINKPLCEALPEAAGQGYEKLLTKVFTTGKPVAAKELTVDLERNGKMERTYINFVFEPYYNFNGSISGVIVLANEITDQVLAIKKIEQAEERARMAIESAELGFYENHIITGELFTDNVFNTCIGFNHPVTQADFILAIHPEDLLIRENAYAEALLTSTLKYEVRFVWKDNSIHWIKVTGKVVYDEQNQPVKIHGVVQDITAQKDIDRQKDDFISMVSHELKTPLTSLKGFTYMLKENLELLKDEESTVIVTRMNNQVNRLIYIIQDLTDVTRIESNQIKFREIEFDFSEFLIDIVEEVQSSTQTHKILFDVIETAKVFADKERTSQVVTNLLINSFKYSPKATTVIVAAHLQNDEIICSIKDFGSGIANDKQTKIFEKYYQLTEVDKSNAGFGLGLYISAQIIKRQNGRIWVESVLGKGSTFYFSLPLAK